MRERPPLNQAILIPRELEPNSNQALDLAHGRMGIAVQEVTEQHRKAYRVEGGQNGVIVINVAQLSPAAEAGLVPGDLILEINKHPVRSLVEYQKLISHFKREDVVMLLISRPKNDTRIVTLRLADSPTR